MSVDYITSELLSNLFLFIYNLMKPLGIKVNQVRMADLLCNDQQIVILTVFVNQTFTVKIHIDIFEDSYSSDILSVERMD